MEMCVSLFVCVIIIFTLQAANLLHRVSFLWQGGLGMGLGPYHWSAVSFPRAKLLVISGRILPHQTAGVGGRGKGGRGGGEEGGGRGGREEGDSRVTETQLH